MQNNYIAPNGTVTTNVIEMGPLTQLSLHGLKESQQGWDHPDL